MLSDSAPDGLSPLSTVFSVADVSFCLLCIEDSMKRVVNIPCFREPSGHQTSVLVQEDTNHPRLSKEGLKFCHKREKDIKVCFLLCV